MLQTKSMTYSWGMGLSEEQIALLKDTLGDDHDLLLYADDAWPSEQQTLGSAPHVVWVSSRGCTDLHLLPQALAHFSEPALIVTLLEEGYDLQDFEKACDHGIVEIIRPPLNRKRIAEIMRRALELRAVHFDMDCMTREIVLERELLERKNEILSFLVNFVTGTTETLDLEHLLRTAFTGLKQMLPVRAMHAALWERKAAGPATLTLYISAAEQSEAHEVWSAALLNQSYMALGGRFCLEEVRALPLEGKPADFARRLPRDGALLTLPLICDSEQIGLIMLTLDTEKHLGRDQAMALDSAMRHFALSIKNARRFKQMQMYADFDVLTRVHNRRHFEQRLEDEMQRYTRYGQPLSVLMLDIDHFKNVNDTHGHHVGDLVLREIASVISDSIRSSDYCARYGGEEFIVLLPHTGNRKASALAERIRRRIARHTFLGEGGRPLAITASIGVANLSGDASRGKEGLLHEADAALYRAKSDGRNRTCSAPVNFTAKRNSKVV